MTESHRPEPHSTAVVRAINATAATAGGLYLTTHSIPVTAIGTGAASLLACWTLWLAHLQARSAAASQERGNQTATPKARSPRTPSLGQPDSDQQ
jgi:hypothetical protein